MDITHRVRKETEIIYAANHDYLTNLHNRRYLVNAFSTFVLQDCSPLGFMMIDINGLKIINDAYGHAKGDIAIQTVANILKDVIDKDDVVARIGGDEFAVLSPHKDLSAMQAYKDKLVEKYKEIKINNIPLSLAIGYDIFSDTDKSLDDLLSRAENHMYQHKTSFGVSVRNNAIKAILNTLTMKYEEEKIHSQRVSHFCGQIGTELGLDEDDINLLTLAGLFHDIGKISIPDVIINKPDRLTKEEFEIIKTHTQIGYQILRAADQYSGLAEFALTHHERWDGKGYPTGLQGKAIPLFSRIINVADSYEAMTADRPYRKGMSHEYAIAEIQRCSGSQFDPEIATLFLTKKLMHEQ
jgi:diguanylate cyclase